MKRCSPVGWRWPGSWRRAIRTPAGICGACPRYAALLCERAGTSLAVCARVSVGAFLHDLGKVGIPDAILRKASALRDDERAVIQTHPELGGRLLAGHPLAHWAFDAVHSHHERPDGHRRAQR